MITTYSKILFSVAAFVLVSLACNALGSRALLIGNVGLFAWSGEELNGTDVAFDDFVVTKLP